MTNQERARQYIDAIMRIYDRHGMSGRVDDATYSTAIQDAANAFDHLAPSRQHSGVTEDGRERDS